MSDNFIDTVVIGAGVVGLAIARKFALSKKDVLLLEEQSTFGTITSTRNSGVIHAGVSYDKDSLKSKLCPIGNRLLYDYCEQHKNPHINTGKFIKATVCEAPDLLDNNEERILNSSLLVAAI